MLEHSVDSTLHCRIRPMERVNDLVFSKLIATKFISYFFVFLTASKYCGSGLKIDLVVVVFILVVVIQLLSNSSAFVKV